MESPQKFFSFQETLIFQEVTFQAQKNKKALLKCFLHFRKWNFPAPSLKNFSYFRRNFQSPKNQNLSYFSKKSYEQIFPKALSDNSFHLFNKLNQTMLLLCKNIESLLLRLIFLQLFDIFIIYRFTIIVFYYIANFFPNYHIFINFFFHLLS